MVNIIIRKNKDGPVDMERVRRIVRDKLGEEQARLARAEAHFAPAGHNEADHEDRPRNGFSGKKKDWRRIGRIPASAMRAIRADMGGARDDKYLKSLLRENQWNTVARDSF